MRNFVAIVAWCCCFVLTINANNQTGNDTGSSKPALANSESDLSKLPGLDGMKFNDNYKNILSDSSSTDLDILNDSSEVTDKNDELSRDVALKFDDFVSKKELELSLEDGRKMLESSLMNVFKVPKSKTKKTLSSRHSSIKNEPIVNDFNSELLFSVNDGNLTDYETYFHAFTLLFDHSRWNVNSFSLAINKACLKDVQTYLNDLSLSKDWALMASDTSGRYRGQFYFDNAFWMGSKQFCYEVNYEFNDKIPELQFFVFKFLIKMEPVYHKVREQIIFSGPLSHILSISKKKRFL